MDGSNSNLIIAVVIPVIIVLLAVAIALVMVILITCFPRRNKRNAQGNLLFMYLYFQCVTSCPWYV